MSATVAAPTPEPRGLRDGWQELLDAGRDAMLVVDREAEGRLAGTS